MSTEKKIEMYRKKSKKNFDWNQTNYSRKKKMKIYEITFVENKK